MRVLSLLPAATDIICWLGHRDDLVAITHECDARGASIPRVTSSRVTGSSAGAIDDSVRTLAESGVSMFELDEHRIRQLAPDLIITHELCDVCAVSETDVRVLAASMSPPPKIVTLGATTIDQVEQEIEAVARAIHADVADGALLNSLRERHATIHNALKGAKATRRQIAIIEWTDPLYAAGHWVPDLVRRAGGADVLAKSGDHSRRVTMDEIVQAAPEIVVIAPCGYDLSRARAEAKAWLPASHLPGSIEVWAMDSNRLLSRPGPDLWFGMETLASIMHPELFGQPAAERACQISPR